MEPAPDSRQPSYRTRNTVLAVIVLVMVVAAVVRLGQTAKEAPPAAAPPVAAQTPAGAMPVTAAAAPGGIIDVDVTFAGATPALPDGAKVYVFVRPVGDRMPLAVQMYTPGDLPVAVQFSNPVGASAAASVEVVARLSMTGAVTLQTGDAEVVSAPVRFDAGPRAHLSLALGGGASVAPAEAAPVPVGVFIPVHVTLGQGIDLPATTTVFVIVREPGGSPMPLAVKRLTVAELPADIVLTDADAMMPGRTLGSAVTVEVIARASRSGEVKAAAGDFEARSDPLRTAGFAAKTPIQLVIAHPV